MKFSRNIAIASIALALAVPVAAETLRTEYQQINLEQVAGGLSNPWALAFLPDGRLLVTERSGRLLIIDGDEVSEVQGAPEVTARGQGGLLDVALHPDFENNRLVYLTWSQGAEDGVNTATSLSRGRLEEDRLVDVETLFVQDRFSSPGRHYGSRLAWLPDGSLLMSIGDRGAEPPRSQDLADHAGTLLRLTEDGEPAPGNPFLDRDDVLPEIYSYGHRNIQGLLYHPESGEIWATEHGPRGGDELNLIEPGNNYGWPDVSLGRNYRTEETYFEYTARHKEGMVDPVIDWTPGIAPSGLVVLTGERFPNWQGNLLAGGLRAEEIRRVVFADGIVVHEERLIQGKVGRIRDLAIGPEGDIWLVTDNGEGNDGVWRISPAE